MTTEQLEILKDIRDIRMVEKWRGNRDTVILLERLYDKLFNLWEEGKREV